MQLQSHSVIAGSIPPASPTVQATVKAQLDLLRFDGVEGTVLDVCAATGSGKLAPASLLPVFLALVRTMRNLYPVLAL